MASQEPTECTSGAVPTAVKGVNRLAAAGFLLSLAAIGTGLYSLSLLNATLGVRPPYGPLKPAPEYTVPSILYWGSLAASIAAIVMGRTALSQFKQHRHEKAHVDFGQGALQLGIVAVVVLVCGGVSYSVFNAVKGLH